MTMTRFGISYGEGKWECKNCGYIFVKHAESACPKCSSNAISPIADTIASNRKETK